MPARVKPKPKHKIVSGAVKEAFNRVNKKREGALWKGPEDSSAMGGITQSMLGGFLFCRERFRIANVLGLQPPDSFRHAIEFGSMWHICEEYANAGEDWGPPLLEYVQKLLKRYRLQQADVEHWYHVCKTQYPIYWEYWSKHPDVRGKKCIMQEEVFHIPYELPSGRTVYLRGKFDSVDLIGPKRSPKVYLQENKTKGDIREEQIRKQLHFDLQTMFYLTALREHFYQRGEIFALGGVRYNVVRRPLSGGKGSIRRHQGSKNKPAETKQAFYQRLAGIIEEDPKYFFMRWKTEVDLEELEQFENEFLIATLEQLCDWYVWVSNNEDPYGVNPDTGRAIHWRFPYGTWNPLTDGGGSTEYDEYIATGNKVGLTLVDTLFRELQDD